MPVSPAAIANAGPSHLVLSGCWTVHGISAVEEQLQLMTVPPGNGAEANGSRIEALDSTGAWVLQKLLLRQRESGASISLLGLQPEHARLMEAAASGLAEQAKHPAPAQTREASLVERVGKATRDLFEQTLAMLAFVGEIAMAILASMRNPGRLRWRPILYNVRTAGFDAVPIVGVLSFLLGVVVAYQGAAQLRQYGANIFVADLVGLSMLREFAPLITAIIIAGRSGSAYAAQIGTMKVTEEIDAMHTIGMPPLDILVIPKVLALVIVLPLLTVFADAVGVFGGMIMARSQLGVGFDEFLDRFVDAVSVTTFLTGIGKAPVFAVIIAVVGCFQGFQTSGGADSVGRQTTRSVVQSIFLVIVADALFSVAFSMLDL